MVDTISYFANKIIYISTLLTSIWKRKEFVSFCKELGELKINHSIFEDIKNDNCLKLLFVFLLLCTGIIADFYMYSIKGELANYFYILNFILMLVISTLLIQIISIFIIMLKKYFVYYNQQLYFLLNHFYIEFLIENLNAHYRLTCLALKLFYLLIPHIIIQLLVMFLTVVTGAEYAFLYYLGKHEINWNLATSCIYWGCIAASFSFLLAYSTHSLEIEVGSTMFEIHTELEN